MMTPAEREAAALNIYEGYKCAYGFKARHIDFNSLSDAELVRMETEVLEDAERAVNEEREQEQRNLVRWEQRLAELIALGAGDRATAIRWDMQAEDCDGDVGYYCYKVGIPYATETSIRETLGVN